MFAALSTSPELNDKIAFFGALAPALKPHGKRFCHCTFIVWVPDLSLTIVLFFFPFQLETFLAPPLSHLIKISPNVMFTLFGRRSFMDLARVTKAVLPPSMFKSIIASALQVLFRWRGDKFDDHAKVALYAHVFGHVSVKTYTHWFQIVKSGRFQRYNPNPHLATSHSIRRAVAPSVLSGRTMHPEEPDLLTDAYPTWKITTPTALFMGGLDPMTDVQYFRDHVGGVVDEILIPDYSHMDFVWATCMHDKVWKRLFQHLEVFAKPSPSPASSSSSSLQETEKNV
jgi:lysosomal acid lipase/cholesteryl ester hydrolase